MPIVELIICSVEALQSLYFDCDRSMRLIKKMIVAFANLSFKSLQRHQQQLLLFVQPVCMVVRVLILSVAGASLEKTLCGVTVHVVTRNVSSIEVYKNILI